MAAVLLALPMFGGCLGDVLEQAQNAAVRQHAAEELKQFSQAFIGHHDAHGRAPKDWQELASFAPAGLQQSLEAKRYTIVWGVGFAEMKAGTSAFPLVYPSDAATNGGLVLMADGSTHMLTAAEFNQKVGDHQAASNPAPQAAFPVTTPVSNSTPSPAPVAAAPAQTASFAATPAGAGEFKPGDRAFTPYNGQWEPIEILEVIPGGYRVRWMNWPDWGGWVRGAPVHKELPPGAKLSTGPTSRPQPMPGLVGQRDLPGKDDDPGIAVDDETPLAVGDKVYAKWLANWVSGEVVAVVGRHGVTVRLEQEPLPIDPTLPRRFIRLQVAPDAAAAPPGPPDSPAATVTPGGLRTWTDASGKFQIEAKFISANDDHVTLEKPDGSHIRLPSDKLSPADQQYIAEQR
jgi:hypothetical protein